jgi:uncharacterized phage protein (TIGR02220 family)
MNKDFRVLVGFTSHPKFVKLKRRVGDRGLEYLLRLWEFTAQYKPDGNLTGMTDEDVEIAVAWEGEYGGLCAVLVELKWLDFVDGVYRVHDWQEHNPYALHAKDRSERAKKMAAARWDKETPHAAATPRRLGENAVSNAVSIATSNAPPPVPFPEPDPHPSGRNGCAETSVRGKAIPPSLGHFDPEYPQLRSTAKRILSYINEKCGTHYTAVRDSQVKEIIARLREGESEEAFRTIIDKKRNDPYFKKNPNLFHPDTLFSAEHFAKYLEEPVHPEPECPAGEANPLPHVSTILIRKESSWKT